MNMKPFLVEDTYGRIYPIIYAAYMRQWIRPALVQIMARRLSDAKPLSKPVLGCRQLDP